MSLVELDDYLFWWLKGVTSDGLPRAETIGSVAGARGFRDGEQAFRSAEAAERSRLGLPSLAVLSAFALRPEQPVGSGRTPLGTGSSGVAAGPFPREDLPHPPAWTGDHPPPAPAVKQPLPVLPGTEDVEALDVGALREALGPRRAVGVPLTAGGGLTTPTDAERFSLQMLLWCPECGKRHVDVGVWATRRHHTHACQHCGHTWRPAVIDTFGVQFLPGFKNEPEGGAA